MALRTTLGRVRGLGSAKEGVNHWWAQRTTAVALVFLYAIGLLGAYVHGGLGDTLEFISFSSRYQPFARGLIDTRAVVYFLSVTIVCLLVSFRSLESRKWS